MHNGLVLRECWNRHAEEWIARARTPGHDCYWRFHRVAFFPSVLSPGALTLDVDYGEGRVGRNLATLLFVHVWARRQ